MTRRRFERSSLTSLLPLLVFAAACDNSTSPETEQVTVSISSGPLALVIEETAQLQAQVSDGTSAVAWSSDDAAIATVNSTGLVEAVSPGTTRIEAALVSSSEAAASLTVTVTDACATVVGTAPVGSIGSGGVTSSGTLGAGDCFRDGVRSDRWAIELPTDVGLDLWLDSEFAGKLLVEDLDGNVLIESAPGAAGVAGQAQAATGLAFSTEPGSYIVVVTGGTGAYDLTVSQHDRCNALTGLIARNQAATQEVTGIDCPLPSGRRADLWFFSSPERGPVGIRATSDEFAPTVIVTEADVTDPESTTPIARFGPESSPFLEGVTLMLDPGDYRIWVLGEESGADGLYELVVDSGAGAIIAWGVALEYGFNSQEEAVSRNVFRFLTGGATDSRMLFTRGCDPRVDSKHCYLVSDLETLDPFYDVVDEFGTLEYRDPLAVTDFTDYDVIFAPHCAPFVGDQSDRAEVHEKLEAAVRAGVRVFVSGESACSYGGVDTTVLANEFLEPLGVRFTDLDPRVPEEPVPEERRVGFLEGVSTFTPWRMAPLILDSGDWRVGAEASTGVVSYVRSFPVDGW
ncbi:Ig-like domain-containing protein [Gaopeijia maritima]|uniref:Ig-like domain-containing protein n=1 Tax=Gaopeijia maritima TaxID=3119007 RepID=UPI003270ADFA